MRLLGNPSRLVIFASRFVPDYIGIIVLAACRLGKLIRTFNQNKLIMKIRLILISVISILLCPVFSEAQEQQGKITVTGTVVDERGEPLPGAFVLVPGTTSGTSTDADGKFSINVSAGSALEIQFMGYETKKISVPKERRNISVSLSPDKNLTLNEAVTIAYGSVRRQDLTGSVTNVKMADVKDAPVLSVDQALQGRIAGADIMTTSGEPGAATSIRIRGTRSIIASNEPLIVVDGVMDAVSDLGDLNSADIESISVLKDASSTAIYGSRGSNGVIIVTTRQGSTGSKPRITFKAEAGISQLPKKLDLMNASEYAQYRNDIALYLSSNTDAVPGAAPSEYPYPDPLSYGQGTDWIGAIMRTAAYQNYNLSLSGGNKEASYYASLGYNDTEGIVKNSGQTRYTGRINLDRQLFKWMKVGYKGSYTYRSQDKLLANIGGTSTRSAMYLSPLLKKTDYYITDDEDNVTTTYNPPTALIAMRTNYVTRLSANHSVYVEIEPVKDLKLRSSNSYYSYQQHGFVYNPSTLPAKNPGEGGDATRNERDDMTLSSENTVTYALKKQGHKLDVLGGFTAYRFKSDRLALSGSGYMVDDVKWNNMGGVTDKNTLSPSSASVSTTKMSFLARANYNYKSRYYITVTGRADGASNFAANNKWGFFPSAALKWNVKKENFMKHVSWIDELSLRLSAGRTGNDAVDAYRSLEMLSTSSKGYIFGGSQQAAYFRGQLPSPDLTWEKTDLYNVATDMSFFNSRLNVTAEAYVSKTRDLLMEVQVASQTGFNSHFVNLGNTSNYGVELSIESRNIVRKGFTWTTNLTLSHNKQNVDNIGTSEYVSVADSGGNNPFMMHGFVKGYPLNALWGFRYAGVWHNTDEFRRNEVTHAYTSSSVITADKYENYLGTPRYYDINNDGTLDQQDLVYLGNADPWLYGGLQNTFTLGNFRLGVYVAYSFGGKIYNYSELFMAGGNTTNQYRYMVNAWHPVRNPESDYPRAGGTMSKDVPSDRMVYDASYVRLKNVSLGYTFDLSKKVKWLRDITLNLSGENLLLWKKYNGFDPDVSSSGSESTLRRLDMGAYPKARTIVFSVQFRY